MNVYGITNDLFGKIILNIINNIFVHFVSFVVKKKRVSRLFLGLREKHGGIERESVIPDILISKLETRSSKLSHQNHSFYINKVTGSESIIINTTTISGRIPFNSVFSGRLDSGKQC